MKCFKCGSTNIQIKSSNIFQLYISKLIKRPRGRLTVVCKDCGNVSIVMAD